MLVSTLQALLIQSIVSWPSNTEIIEWLDFLFWTVKALPFLNLNSKWHGIVAGMSDVFCILDSGGGRESSRVRASYTAIHCLLLNGQIALDLSGKAAMPGRNIMSTYFFSFWWFHTDVSAVPLACKGTEHLQTVCSWLSEPNRMEFSEKEHGWKSYHDFSLSTNDFGIEIHPSKGHSIDS